MPDPAPGPYRFRGSVAPSATASRPLALRRGPAAATGDASKGATSATLDLFDVVDSYGGWWGISAEDVAAALAQIPDVDTIFVRLNSPGGQATEGVAIANLLRAHKADVRVTVYGIAASAASVIAIAGDAVYMAPGSILMIHDAWDIAWGDAAEMLKAATVLDAVSDSYASLYALKGGGKASEWRDVMRAEKWYPADDAVAAKLADAVGLDPQLPAGQPPVEPEEDDDEDPEIEIDVEITVNPAARAAARRFDLSMFTHAPAALAPKTPAEPPVVPSITPEEADTMSDNIPKAVVEALGLPDDADEAATAAAIAQLKTERDEAKASTRPKPKADDDAVKAVVASLEANGQKVVSQAYLDTLKEGADAGRVALARQSREDRDGAIAKAQAEGKIGRSEETVKSWQSAWDRDPAATAKEINDLGVRFPVGPVQGRMGAAEDVTDEVFSDDQADELGSMFGVRAEALKA